MAPERRAILQRCSLASITPVWMVMVADRYLCFGLAVALAARSLAGCYFPRGCCVSACTSRGMKHSMGQLTFCREGRKAVSALSREGRHLWGGGDCWVPARAAAQLCEHKAGARRQGRHYMHYCQSMQASPGAAE